MENEKNILSLPIDWHIPKDLRTGYATNLVVQHTEHEFILSFYEVYPPILLGSKDDIANRVEELDTVRAECVGRMVVSAERMSEFIKVMQNNLTKYQDRQKEME